MEHHEEIMKAIAKVQQNLDGFITYSKPAIENMNNLTAGWKIVLGIFATIGVIFGGIVAFLKFLHNIK